MPAELTCSRKNFLRLCAAGVAGAFLHATPSRAQTQPVSTSAKKYDLRDFVRWILEEMEPSARLPGPAGHYSRVFDNKTMELYGTADMACILYTIGQLHPTEKQRSEWADAFNEFQNPDTGYLVEKSPTLSPLHNTAFALAAMNLLDLTPKYPLKFAEDFKDPVAALSKLDWKTAVYLESHKGAGMGAIFALSPGLADKKWFDDYFSFCDQMFDPHNGLMGQGKPPGGDYDQVGGTFHYSFLFNYFNRRMPFPERRIDSVIGTRNPDGYWLATNHLWLTLDAMYLLTRTSRYCDYRKDDIRALVRSIMDQAMSEVYSPDGRKKSFVGKTPVHSVTCAINMAAEAQNFLGADEVITDWPLHIVLDRRPFI
jgi:hypothetical protein